MATAIALDTFLSLLQKSRLLTDGQCAAAQKLVRSVEATSSPQAADALVDAGILTRYQANRLSEGRRRGLFIDDFKIIELLGCGGMGYLYRAEDLRTGWEVALKVLADRFRFDKGRLTRFQLEAEAGLKLSHPNILRTKAIHRTDDIYGAIHYMVMELVKGVSLRELLEIRRRTLYWRHSCDVICQAATGLHYVHQMGLVHRDIKPENLLIRSDGAVKVLDFGLAMIGGSDAEYSLATILGQNCLGTADYIAPEQSLDSLNVDCRADIYSLGYTFYFLVTGQVPFPVKATAEKLAGHRTGRPPDVRELNPKVPEQIAKIIKKMTAKHPEHRFQTADEVRQILAPLAQRKPIDFDFDAVLTKRATLAEQRLASESILRGDSRVTAVSKLEISNHGELQSPRADTIVRKDTIVDRRGRES